MAVLMIVLLFNLLYSYVYDLQFDSMKEDLISVQMDQVDVMDSVLMSVFETIYNDLQIIYNSDEFSRYIQSPGDLEREDTQQLFFRIASSKAGFVQIRYLDESGREQMRINRQGDLITIVPEEELQLKKSRYYFQDALEVAEGKMYISEFDLNVEQGSVVKPYEPVIRFATPVYNQGVRQGVLVINYDGYRLLSILEGYNTFETRGMEAGILDSLYYWKVGLLNIEGVNHSSKVSLNVELRDTPDSLLWQFREQDAGTFESDGVSYAYSTIVFDENYPACFRSRDKRWKIVSSLPLETIISGNRNIILDYPELRYVFLIAIALLHVFLFGMVRIRQVNDLMLKASSYISSHTHDGVLIIDRHKKVVFCNRVFEGIFGWTESELDKMDISLFFKSEDGGFEFHNALEKEWSGNFWSATAYGLLVNKHLHIHTIRDDKNKVGFYVGIFSVPKLEPHGLTLGVENSDMVEVVQNYDLNKQIEGIDRFLAEHERVIGLAIKLTEYSKIVHALPEYGETLLVGTVCEEMNALMFNPSLMLSPNPDVFIVLVALDDECKDVETLTRKIDLALSNANYKLSSDIRMTFYCGLSMYPLQAANGLEFLKQIFVAMDANVKLLRMPFLQFDENIHDMISRDQSIQSEIDNGFSNDEFYVVYQVQNSLRDNRITGVEALVRWHNKKLGDVSPDKFIPIMERNNSIMRMGLVVLRKIIEDFERDPVALPDGFRISFNLSSAEFMDKRVVSELLYMMGQSKLGFERFCIEITETTIVTNIHTANQMIRFLNEHGVIVAIDDFGTGFSSLSYLKQLQADKLKIDRMFIMDYPERDDGSILRAIMAMAKNLDMETIMEGVETAVQHDFIAMLQCDVYQGYYFDKPKPYSAFSEKML